MEMPTVSNVRVDPARKITYVFMAYRKMTEYEIAFGIQQIWQQRRKPKNGTRITVLTMHGAVD